MTPKKNNSGLTQGRLRELLNYDAATGSFTWRVSRRGSVYVGSPAGFRRKNGYHIIGVDGEMYFAHRLAWLWLYGKFPDGWLDHKDGIRWNNAIENLREASGSENAQNRPFAPGRSGYVGVRQAMGGRSFEAKIKTNGKSIRLGSFKTAEEARAAYLAAKKVLHKFQPMAPGHGADVVPYTVTPEGRAIAAAYKKRQEGDK